MARLERGRFGSPPFRRSRSARYARAAHDGREPPSVVVLRRSPLYFLIARVVVRDHRVLSSIRVCPRPPSAQLHARQLAVIARHDVAPLSCGTTVQCRLERTW